MNGTEWRVQTNAAYDALCLLNVFTDQALYTAQHSALVEQWQPRLTATALGTLQRVQRAFEIGILSARLCLLFSDAAPQTLDDLERAAVQPGQLLRAYRALPYANPEEEQRLKATLPDLLTLIRFLHDHHFEARWAADLGPAIGARLANLRQTLARYGVVPAAERALGRPVDAAIVEVYVQAYTAPHGIKLIGPRFITAPSWPAEVTVRVAVHELMHPPFDLHRPELQAAFTRLARDPELWAAFAGHDPQFGYTTWDGYVEENCVRALDQVIAESFGIARDAQERFRQEDAGVHVLAARLTPLLRRRTPEGFFGDWLTEQVERGELVEAPSR